MNFPTNITIDEFQQIEKYLESIILKYFHDTSSKVPTKEQDKKCIQNYKPILFEYSVGKVTSTILDLTFYSADTFKRTKHFVKWNGSIGNPQKAKGMDIIAKARGYTAIIDVTLNSRTEPQISRELGSFSAHLKKAIHKDKQKFVIGIFVAPKITDRLWELFKIDMDAVVVLMDVANIAKIYSITQFGIPVQHARLLRLFNNLSFRLKSSNSRGEYMSSLNDVTKSFIRDFLKSEHYLFLSKKAYLTFLGNNTKTLSLGEITNDLKKDPLIKNLIKLIDPKIIREDKIRYWLKGNLTKALNEFTLVIENEITMDGELIYFKPECEDSKCVARVIDSIC